MSLALMQALLGSRFLITPRTGEHQESKRRQVNGRCQAPSRPRTRVRVMGRHLAVRISRGPRIARPQLA